MIKLTSENLKNPTFLEDYEKHFKFPWFDSWISEYSYYAFKATVDYPLYINILF